MICELLRERPPLGFLPLGKKEKFDFFFLDLSRKTLPFLGGGLSWCWNIHLLFSLAVTTQDQKSFSFSGVCKNLMLCQPCYACTDVPAQRQSAAFQCTWGLNLLPQPIPDCCFQSFFAITKQWKCREARRLFFASVSYSRNHIGIYFTEILAPLSLCKFQLCTDVLWKLSARNCPSVAPKSKTIALHQQPPQSHSSLFVSACELPTF